jgi:hypothetical protein
VRGKSSIPKCGDVWVLSWNRVQCMAVRFMVLKGGLADTVVFCLAGSGVPSPALSDSATQYHGADRCVPRQVGVVLVNRMANVLVL